MSGWTLRRRRIWPRRCANSLISNGNRRGSHRRGSRQGSRSGRTSQGRRRREQQTRRALQNVIASDTASVTAHPWPAATKRPLNPFVVCFLCNCWRRRTTSLPGAQQRPCIGRAERTRTREYCVSNELCRETTPSVDPRNRRSDSAATCAVRVQRAASVYGRATTHASVKERMKCLANILDRSSCQRR